MRTSLLLAALALTCHALAQTTSPKVLRLLADIKRQLETQADRYPGSGGQSYLRVKSISAKSIDCSSFAGTRRQSHSETYSFEWRNVQSVEVNGQTVTVRLKSPVDIILSNVNGKQEDSQHGVDAKVTFDFRSASNAKTLKQRIDALRKVLTYQNGLPAKSP